MVKANITLGWHSPTWPKWDDDTDGGKFTKQNFWKWMGSAGVDGGGETVLCSIGLLGIYLTLYMQYFDHKAT